MSRVWFLAFALVSDVRVWFLTFGLGLCCQGWVSDMRVGSDIRVGFRVGLLTSGWVSDIMVGFMTSMSGF